MKIREQAELERLRAVKLERSNCEERLVQQMRHLQSQLDALGNREAQERQAGILQARAQQVQLASKSGTTARCGEKADPVMTTGHVVQVNESV